EFKSKQLSPGNYSNNNFQIVQQFATLCFICYFTSSFSFPKLLMYRFILFLTFSFISFGAFTQLTVKDLKDSKTYLLHPDDLKWNKKLVPFNNIIVIDNRFDT